MKTLTPKIALAISVALAALLAAEAAYAQRYDARQRYHAEQRYRAAPRASAPSYQPWGSRFTPEEQRIIDSITENDWRNGK